MPEMAEMLKAVDEFRESIYVPVEGDGNVPCCETCGEWLEIPCRRGLKGYDGLCMKRCWKDKDPDEASPTQAYDGCDDWWPLGELRPEEA